MPVLVWIKKAALHVLPIFLFFLVFFTLINWVEAFLFEYAGFTPFRFIEVVIAAALIAKIVLIVDHLPIIHLFRSRPLAYVIFWKTCLYWILLLMVRFLIRLTPFFFLDGNSFRIDFAEFILAVNWHLFLSIQVFYLMLLFIFVTFQELTVKIGSKKMRQLFFGK